MRRFRVWHTELGRYLKDNEFYINPDGSVYSAFESYNDKIRKTNYIENFSRDDFDEGYIIREDDTGLKDKNGKEIYEGDILEDGSGEPLEYWVVRFEYGKFIGSTQGVDEDIFELTDLEIIGNIHENYDLLEGK